jgi:hypothetical protein
MSGDGEREGPAWGGEYERERAKEREELLAKLPEELRASGAAALAACEEDFQTWAYAVATVGLASALKRGGAAGAVSEQQIDVARQVLEFYRLACLTESVKFWYEAASTHGEALSVRDLAALLARSHNAGLARAKKASERLQLLLEGLKGSSHEAK